MSSLRIVTLAVLLLGASLVASLKTLIGKMDVKDASGQSLTLSDF